MGLEKSTTASPGSVFSRLPGGQPVLLGEDAPTAGGRSPGPHCRHHAEAVGEKELPGPDGDLRTPRLLIKLTHFISIFFIYWFKIYLVEGVKVIFC